MSKSAAAMAAPAAAVPTPMMLARSSHSLLKSSHVHIARIVLAQFSCMYMYMLMPQRVSIIMLNLGVCRN